MTERKEAIIGAVIDAHRRPNTQGRVGEPFVSGEATPTWPEGICNGCGYVVNVETGAGHGPDCRHRTGRDSYAADNPPCGFIYTHASGYREVCTVPAFHLAVGLSHGSWRPAPAPGSKAERRMTPKPLNEAALARVRDLHQPAIRYRGSVRDARHNGPIPLCRACRQSWPCDAANLLATLDA